MKKFNPIIKWGINQKLIYITWIEYDNYLTCTIVIINSITIDDLKTSWKIFNVFSKYISMLYSNVNKAKCMKTKINTKKINKICFIILILLG